MFSFYVYRLPRKFAKDSSKRNIQAEHYGTVRFECYKLTELLSSHINNIIGNYIAECMNTQSPIMNIDQLKW